jgi:hypothetical protein
VVRGCPCLVAPDAISSSHSHTLKYEFGLSLEIVVSDWVDGEFPYPLGDLFLATMLDWALFGDKGIEDVIEDTPWRVRIVGSS